jgi:hypothetical protein
MNKLKKQILDSAENFWGKDKVTAPRLKILCKFINDSGKFKARLEFTDNIYKDRQLTGTRLRSEGIREYKGNILRIYDLQGKEVKEHDSTETYRQNWEVCQWIKHNIIEVK